MQKLELTFNTNIEQFIQGVFTTVFNSSIILKNEGVIKCYVN